MQHFFFLLGASLLLVAPALAQDLTNAGSTITVQAGASVYVGTGGLSNASGTLTNAGALRVDGPLTNPSGSTLDLSTGTLEVRGDVTNAGTLTPGTSAVTFSGLADQLLTPGGATLYQMLVSKPTSGANTLRLAGDLTVSNLLSLTNGYVTTKSPGGTVYTLSLPITGSVSGEASGRYVLGNLAVTRSLGTAAVNFSHGATLDPAGNTLGTVTISRAAGLKTADVSYGQNMGGPAKGIDRIYTVAAATQPTAAVQLTLTWLPDDDNGLTDFTQARGWQQTAVGQPWTVVGAPTNASSRSIALSPTVLNRFTVSNAANPLPVTLLAFTAKAEGDAAVRLNWATASETDNVGFEVERSLDGARFVDVGWVAGAGTSLLRHDYTLLDTRLPAGATLLYYRLRQVDGSGKLSYSVVRTVALAAGAAGFVVYPTRVGSGQAATYLYSGPAEAATLRVLDVLGRTLREVAVDGRAQGEVPLAGLATGSYVLRYTTATASFTSRCVVE